MSKPLLHTLWRWAYSLEEARQTHAGGGRLIREAGCCLTLAALRFVGVWL